MSRRHCEPRPQSWAKQSQPYRLPRRDPKGTPASRNDKNKMLIKFKFLLILLFCLLLPTITFSVGFTDPVGVTTFTQFFGILESLIWKVFALFALVSFVIAGIFFLTAQGQPEKLKIARSFVLWGVVSIIVAILAYSIITIVESIF
ncbi:MAG: hypothetical protein UR22_C0009G0009 [Parcubacteria group bacterium GW2011_GWC2_32_10]|nr:MAG: hypothetical protein UR22_C0009G0009 [Parcubacteria group bacterium GW2011_GWC2_32_10]